MGLGDDYGVAELELLDELELEELLLELDELEELEELEELLEELLKNVPLEEAK